MVHVEAVVAVVLLLVGVGFVVRSGKRPTLPAGGNKVRAGSNGESVTTWRPAAEPVARRTPATTALRLVGTLAALLAGGPAVMCFLGALVFVLGGSPTVRPSPEALSSVAIGVTLAVFALVGLVAAGIAFLWTRPSTGPHAAIVTAVVALAGPIMANIRALTEVLGTHVGMYLGVPVGALIGAGELCDNIVVRVVASALGALGLAAWAEGRGASGPLASRLLARPWVTGLGFLAVTLMVRRVVAAIFRSAWPGGW